MNELPTDTVVTVDCTGISPSDAVAHRADPPEFFDIEMDELARMLAFITPDRFGRLQGSSRPCCAHVSGRSSPAAVVDELARLGVRRLSGFIPFLLLPRRIIGGPIGVASAEGGEAADIGDCDEIGVIVLRMNTPGGLDARCGRSSARPCLSEVG